MDGKSLNLTEERIEQLKQIFPEVFSEGKVDFARLKDILGEHVVFPNEHYELSWAGKAEARKEIQKQTTNTLIADKEASIDFENAQNLFIEGENLEVLRILQKSYFGKVKMIYIDPPYNTGNDSFVYPDDYAERLDEYKKRAGITDEEGYLNKQDLWRKNTRENGQFHSVWLSMMYPRLYLARNLLREDGVIFVSIDDNEASNLKQLLDEVFGEENFIGTFPWKKRTAKSDVPFGVSQDYEWVLGYARMNFGAGIEYERKYYQTDDVPNDRWRLSDLTTQRSASERENSAFDMTDPKTGKVYPFNPKRVWGVTKDTFPEYYEKGKIVFPDDYDFLNISIPAYRVFESEDKAKALKKYGSEDAMKAASTHLPKEVGMSEDGNKEIVELFGGKVFPFPKPVSLIKYFLSIANNNEDAIILDFFAGSGSSAHAVLDLNEEDGGNRQFICVQMPELLEENSEAYKAGYRTIADISKARISKVIEKLQKARAEQLALESKPQILGFRSFKIAPSNFKSWRGDAEGEELLKQLDFLKQSEKDGSLHENMLVELLLKSGLALTAKVKTLKAGKAEAYLVEDGRLFLFFGGYNKSIKELIHEKMPQRVVCLDSAFKGKDEDISNFKLELKEAGIELTIL